MLIEKEIKKEIITKELKKTVDQLISHISYKFVHILLPEVEVGTNLQT